MEARLNGSMKSCAAKLSFCSGERIGSGERELRMNCVVEGMQLGSEALQGATLWCAGRVTPGFGAMSAGAFTSMVCDSERGSSWT